MKLICIRHLPTQWNKIGLLQGRRDVNILLPDESCMQAIHQNLIYLKESESFDLACVSSLKRTQQTASMYDILDTVVEPLLDEINFGVYEGKPRANLLEDWGYEWLNDPKNLILGENDNAIAPVAELELRINKFLAKYRAYNQLLIFGHGGWIRGLLSIAKYGSIKKMNQVVVANNQLITLIL